MVAILRSAILIHQYFCSENIMGAQQWREHRWHVLLEMWVDFLFKKLMIELIVQTISALLKYFGSDLDEHEL